MQNGHDLKAMWVWSKHFGPYLMRPQPGASSYAHVEEGIAVFVAISVADPGFVEGGFWYTLVGEVHAKF